jgi:hypothetical protein
MSPRYRPQISLCRPLPRAALRLPAGSVAEALSYRRVAVQPENAP